jgi:hypothetical protein
VLPVVLDQPIFLDHGPILHILLALTAVRVLEYLPKVLAAHQTEESMSLAEEEGGSPRARKRTSRRASPGTPSAARVTRLSSAVLAPSASAVETQDPASGPPGSQNTVSDQALYCSCQRISFGEMVACDNPDCQGGQWVCHASLPHPPPPPFFLS